MVPAVIPQLKALISTLNVTTATKHLQLGD